MTYIILGVFGFLLILISAPYFLSSFNSEQLNLIQKWVVIAVEAAEMIFYFTGKGKEKKQYVLNFLNSKGFKISEDDLNILIESAVLNLKKNK